jgi:2-dehydropantoate 2-reductase
MSPRYALIGDGRLATSLGPYLHQSGAALTLWSRRAEASGGLPLGDAVREADTVLLAISDGAIERFAAEHRSTFEGKRLVHFSGAHSFEGMTGWHPLYSFPAHAVPFTQMSTILFVGEEMDEEGNTDFGEIFPMLSNPRTAITKEEKPLYHALAVLSGNLVSFTWNEVARVLEEELGLPSAPLLAPYFRSLIDGFTASPLDSLTGPVARGDQATIEKNLAALESEPALRPLYDALLTAAARKGIPS